MNALNGASILVVDDEPDVREMLNLLLERAGHTVILASDGHQAIELTEEKRPDVVLLDVSMPLVDGWQTLERIRAFSTVPVLMLTARGTEMDKVRGLKGGADDYVTKPFGRQELLARIEALRRRVSTDEEPETVYQDARLRVDFVQAQVTQDGQAISLTPLEFKLLAAFVRNPGELLSQARLLELVWHTNIGSRDQVKLYVGYLRRKMGWVEGTPIETVRGFGYRYHPAD
jgi:DNA-binding response OmpR family regulator